MHLNKKSLIILASIGIFAFSCSKDNNDSGTYTSAGKDEAIAEYLFSDIFSQTDLATNQLEDGLFGPGMSKSVDAGCATITIAPYDTISWPKTVIIDFGDTNCQGVDNKYRRGRIQAGLTGRYRDSLTVITITPEDFYVNDYRVDGQKTVTNLGHVTEGHMTFDVVISDAVITFPGGKWFSYNSHRTRVWVEGEVTDWPVVADDVYELTGSSDGTTYENVNFHSEITSPLRIERDCRWIVSGRIDLTPQGLATRTLDYGDGYCDSDVTLTIGGKTYQIKLP